MADSVQYIPTTQAPSPDALKARRLAAILQQKEANTVEPIRSPWQGMGRIAQSIAGGYDQYKTDQAEIAARKEAGQHLADALQGNNIGGAVGAMSDPWVNPEAAKTVAAMITPQIKDLGTYERAVDRFGNPVGPVISKQTVATGEAGGAKGPIGTISGGPGGATLTPLQQPAPPGGSGGFPVTGPDGRLQGNLTGNQGQPPTSAPPVGPVAQAPAVPTPLKTLSDFANQQSAQKKGMETSAEAGAKYYDSLHKGLAGSAMIAAQQKQNIDLLRQVASSPNFIPGAGSDAALGLQRLAAQFGINTQGAAPREIFNQVATRILADQISGIKSMASETGETGGRIFKSMLDLEEKANITPQDTMAGIKAKLDLIDNAGNLMMKWGDLADDYVKEHGRLDPGFDKTLRKEISGARIPNAVQQGEERKSLGGKNYIKINGVWHQE